MGETEIGSTETIIMAAVHHCTLTLVDGQENYNFNEVQMKNFIEEITKSNKKK